MTASMISYGKRLVGTQYGTPWQEGDSCLGNHGPFWAAKGQPPPVERLQREGIVCTGLINLMCRNEELTPPLVSDGLLWAGSTDAWWEIMRTANMLERYDLSREYPPGTLLLAPYEGPAIENQGHIGMIIEGGAFLHSSLSIGVAIDPNPDVSHVWANYQAAVLPEDWIAVLRKLDGDRCATAHELR